MTPAFSGNLIGQNVRVSIPDEYFELFQYMDTQNASERIANFPQYDFWGWLYYDWGYRGSGFLWHGLRQPLLDRAFDVWEKNSQNYYEDISTALYSNNQNLFENTIDKYSIDWILIDKHVIAPESRIDTGNKKLENFLSSSSKFQLVKNFNNQIYLFKTDNSKKVHNSLSLGDLSHTLYPFAKTDLRPNTDWIDKANFISVTKDLTGLAKTNSSLAIPSLTNSENELPISVDYQKIGSSLNIRLSHITPTLFVDGRQIDIISEPKIVSIPLTNSSESFILQLNDRYFPLNLPAEVPNFTDYYPLTSLYLPAKEDFKISLYDTSEADSFSLTSILSQSEPVQCYTHKANRKIEKIVTPTSISLLGTDVVGCLSTAIPKISPTSLISYSFTYSSSTLTSANVNISDESLNANNPTQSLETSANPKRVQLFANPSSENQQINLILEAEDTKSLQEITYKDINVASHPLLFSEKFTLSNIKDQTFPLGEESQTLQISFPITSTDLDIRQIPNSNSLFPESKNCDQYNKGMTSKTITSEGILYQSQNAIECDNLNLRHFPHDLNYLISFDTRLITGLPMTVCLENYTTRRCDVFERLKNTDTVQYLIQPIANPEESPGYSLHFFNQSIGLRPTASLLKSLSIRPIPLHFLENISIENSTGPIENKKPVENTKRHNEFFYTLSLKNSSSEHLNLYQTKSTGWQAIEVSSNDYQLPAWELIGKIIFNYPKLGKLAHNDTTVWHNSWNLPPGEHHLAIIYTPQYLEFLGFAIIPLSIFLTLISKLISLYQKNKLVHEQIKHTQKNK